MKVYIIFNHKLRTILLPTKVTGNFVVEENIDGISVQLCNIFAQDGSWAIQSNDFTKIQYGNQFISELNLQLGNSFYIWYENYAIFFTVFPISDDSFKMYSVLSKQITVGGNSNNDIVISNNPLFGDVCFNIVFDDNSIVLNKIQNFDIFVNEKYIPSENIYLHPGAHIWAYGFSIIVYNKIVIFNKLDNLSIKSTNFQLLSITDAEQYVFEEIKDIPIYKDAEYFLRSPRIRRQIEEVKMNIDNPPALKDTKNGGMEAILRIVPSLLGSLISIINLVNLISDINDGTTTLEKSYMRIITYCVTLVTSLIWPFVSKKILKKIRLAENKSIIRKYRNYLGTKKNKIKEEIKLQTEILNENLINSEQCYQIITSKSRILWERRMKQQDFLTFRVGIGNQPLKIKFNIYDDEHFELEEDSLKDEMNEIIYSSKILSNVPINYSLLEKNFTAIMGETSLSYPFVKSMLLQFMTFHGYDELKFVVFTDEIHAENWEFLKKSPHNWNNYMNFRFFASNKEERQVLADLLNQEYNLRKYSDKEGSMSELNYDYRFFPNYYIIFTDIIEEVRKFDFFQNVFTQSVNRGYSVVILENRLSKLPEECTNFINLSLPNSNILEINFEKYNNQGFYYEKLNENLNLEDCCKRMLNIPIEFDEIRKSLPTTLGFLEMYGVGNVEQLNIYNRWKNNDFTKSLKAIIGINDSGDEIYLDVHEKAHGPHGLIAGMTGSGKSEFIITYILSMALNYSPEEVSFILIDYKGGGLAGAFVNTKKQLVLPHLAGTITNLDKSEMNRTLVSINSELKKRQMLFNEARDQLGESTIDIYKYQKFYKEGKLSKPCPHLIIVSDEFAELKSQQPEFMDDLVSAARIGRSLGVHLILATQKPAGVVNGQIWSNSKFKICLKVQDKGDSSEMIKVPDAAYLKNAGRFYLQVGMNELFVLGQSGWCGTQYRPTSAIKKKVDKSVFCINNLGEVINAANFSNEKMNLSTGTGEELVNVLEEIVKVAKEENKFSNKLWLDSVPEFIYIEDLVKKYKFNPKPFNIRAIIGEYDEPEEQRQDILTIDFNTDGNTIIYGSNSVEHENLICSLVYSVSLYHSIEEVNFYILDFGSESLRILSKIPQVGDMAFIDEDEKIKNLFKEITSEIDRRKKLFLDYGGDYVNYCEQSGNKEPIKIIIINNYDVFLENYSAYDENILQITRECQRYGIVFIITTLATGTIRRRIKQNFTNEFVLRFIGEDNYAAILGNMKNKFLAPYQGRGFTRINSILEFQTVLISDEAETLNNIKKLSEDNLSKINKRAPKIPVLPETVSLSDVENDLIRIDSVPIGIFKDDLKVCSLNFNTSNVVTFSASSIKSVDTYAHMLLLQLKKLNQTIVVGFDSEKYLEQHKDLFGQYYFVDDYLNSLKTVINYAKTCPSVNVIIMLFELEKLATEIDAKELENFANEFVKLRNLKLILFENDKKYKKYDMSAWARTLFEDNQFYWIGSGVSLQTLLRISLPSKEMREELSNDYAWLLNPTKQSLVKLIMQEREVDEANE